MTPTEAAALRQRARDVAQDLLDSWSWIADDYQKAGVQLQYNPSESGAAKPLLHDFLSTGARKSACPVPQVPRKPLDARRRAQRQPVAPDA